MKQENAITGGTDTDFTPRATICWGGDVNLGRRMHYRAVEVGSDRVLHVPALKDADLAIINLECVVATKGNAQRKPGEAGPYHFRARPEMLNILSTAGIGMVAVANNHAGDYGNEALLDQTRWLREFGIEAAGFGETEDQAFLPAHKVVGGLKLAFISVDATCPFYAAKKNTPGIAYVDPSTPLDWDRHLGPAIRKARGNADIVLVAAHWGANWEEKPGDAQRALGHFIIDNGAHAVLGSSAHVLQGIEIYKGRPILHDAGDFLFDSKLGDRSSGLFKLEIDCNGVTKVSFVPVTVKFGQTLELSGAEAASASQTFGLLCRELNTPLTIDQNGQGEIVLNNRTAYGAKHSPRRSVLTNSPNTPAVSPQYDSSQFIVTEVPASFRFAAPLEIGPLRMLGFDCKTKQLAGREMLWLESYWTTLQGIDSDWRIDYKVATEDNQPPVIWGASMDHDPCDWMLPTSRWTAGTIYREIFGLRPPDRNALRDGTLLISVRLIGPDGKTNYVNLPGTKVDLKLPSQSTNEIVLPAYVRRALPVQERDALNADELEISFLNVDINWQRTGVEVASLLRCKLFHQELGMTANILTSRFNLHLQDVAEDLRSRDILPARATVHSMYDYFQGAMRSSFPQHNTADLLSPDQHPHEEWQSVANTADHRVFDTEGRKLKYIARNPGTGKVLYVNHFFEEKKWRRDNYDSRGFLSRVQYLNEAGSAVLREHYLRPDGKPALTKVFQSDSGSGTLDYIEILDRNGLLVRKIKTESELIEVWLDRFINRNNQKHLFLIDKSRYLYEPAVNVRDFQPNKQKLTVIPVIHALHTRDHSRPGEGNVNRNYAGIMRDVKRPDAIITLTGGQKTDILKRFGEANIHVIGHAHENSVPPTGFSERDRFKIVYLARYSPEKNHLMAIRAFRRVVDVMPQARLHCFGFGNAGDPTLPAMEKLIRELALEKSVTLHSFVQETAKIYEEAGLAILTSQSEAFGLTVMESLAHGCPVVSFDVQYGPRDLMRNGINGYLVPFADEEALAGRILDIMCDANLHKLLSEGARKSATTFSFEHKAGEWRSLLRHCIKLVSSPRFHVGYKPDISVLASE